MVAFGEAFGRALRAGDVVVLTGELGAGKTTLIRGIVCGTGSTARVRSPSFIRMVEYDGPVRVLHLDLYRVERADPEWESTLAESAAEEAIVLLEWGERIAGLLPRERFEIAIDFDGQARRVTVSATGGGPGERLRALAPALRAAAAIGEGATPGEAAS